MLLQKVFLKPIAGNVAAKNKFGIIYTTKQCERPLPLVANYYLS